MFLLLAAAIVKEQGNMKGCICLCIAPTIFLSRFIACLKEVKKKTVLGKTLIQPSSVQSSSIVTMRNKMKLAAQII
jgi:hypothetical protein